MSVTQTDDTNLNPNLVILVKKDDPEATDPEDTAISLNTRDSLTIELGEEDAETEVHSRSDVVVDPSVQNPSVNFEKMRAVSDDALEEFGIVDADGNYQRGAERTWEHGAEIWYFQHDADVTSDEPDKVDSLGEVRWNVGSFEPDGNGVIYDLTGDIEDSSDLQFGSGGA